MEATENEGVADALEYCEGKLKLPQFQGCGPTVKFIRVFDHLFDVLNSRNPLARNFKAPIRKSNYEYTKRFLDEASDYIRNLKGPEGQSILTSKRKTGFLGFLLCIDAVLGLAEDLVNVENPVLKHLLTYKIEPRSLGIIFLGRESVRWVEQQSNYSPIHSSVQATDDEAQYRRRMWKLHSSRRHEDIERCSRPV